MNAQELKESLTVSDIINFVTIVLGSDGYKEDNAGNPIFQTIDHNERGQGKYKLYYYDDSKIFMSYTAGESMDIFGLVQNAGYASDFKSAFEFVASYFGYTSFIEDSLFDVPPDLTDDWDLLVKYETVEEQKDEEKKELIPLSRSLVEYWPSLLPYIWWQEGMSTRAMQKFGIRMDTINQKIIIPHYDINGNLVGIRGRSFNWLDLQKGAKYSPIYFGDKGYNHPLGENLYGLNLNKESIVKFKRVIIFESEKSVILYETYYPDANCSVAVCGSAISETQINLLLNLGISEVVIAFDKENEDNAYSAKSSEYRGKILKLASLFAPYVNTYYIFDSFQKLGLKDSPIDRGKDIFEFLLKNKIFVSSYNTLVKVKGRKK